MTVPYRCEICAMVEFPTGFLAPESPPPFDLMLWDAIGGEAHRELLARDPKYGGEVCPVCILDAVGPRGLGLVAKTYNEVYEDWQKVRADWEKGRRG